jgi:signal transduction histidine kinase
MSELSDHALPRRRAPLRFVWQMDAEQRFTVGSDEFVALTGWATAAALGRPWAQLAAALSLDPEGQVALALASQETWSGLRVAWPVEGGDERLTVELSGLPIFDRERLFRGYRGFGICRDAVGLGALMEARRGADATPTTALAPSAENVVPLRPSREPIGPALSVVERNAFQELTRELHARLASVSTAPAETVSANAPRATGQAEPALGSGAEAAALARARQEIAALEGRLKAVTEELAAARCAAAPASAARIDLATKFRLDFLARLSHEIRNPLNAIIGFSEVMAQQRLGPLGHEHYRQYAGDIHACGMELLRLLNDLMDLSRIEAGKLDLEIAGMALNPLIGQCVAALQAQAQRARVIIRTALSPALPRVLADARASRQIVLDLICHATKLAGASGQVIVSTTRNDTGEVIVRVRDNGIGMSDSEIALALAPFHPSTTSLRRGGDGGGLGLPLTKALVESNGAALSIKSAAQAGTLIEVTFPQDRVLASGPR